MDINDYIIDDCLIVTPNHLKLQILLNNNSMKNIKVMTKSEFKENYFFKYDINSIYYLMSKYNLKYNVAKMYLDNLLYTELKEIDDQLFQRLVQYKKELLNHNLLIYNPYFKESIKKKKVIVYGYDLDKLESLLFNDAIIIPIKSQNRNYKVYEFSDIDDEVVFIALEIIELLNKGIDIKKIKLVNVTDEYIFPIKRIFGYFNIPIKFKLQLNKINDVLAFINDLKRKVKIDEALKQIKNPDILNCILDICNNYTNDDYNNEIFIDILINSLKEKQIDVDLNTNIIECVNIENVLDDEYVFLIGFNQGSIPIVHKDEDYLTDEIKNKIGIDTSISRNMLEKKKIINQLNRFKNITISYKLKTPYETYLKSLLVEELNCEVIKNYKHPNLFNYSKKYNNIYLGKALDNLLKYNIKYPDLDLLYSNYKNIAYKMYDNRYTGINKEYLHKYMGNKLLLSYSSMDNYYRCGFKYYINNILKLDKYEETFPQFIGNLFHYVLSKAFIDSFDFDIEYNNYIASYNFTNKERFFVSKLKEDLKFIIETIKEQNKLSNVNEELYEEKIYVNKDKEIKITFMGVIDKIKILKENDKNYIAIIDYKTGHLETNLGYTMYGINMQLPVYLYLASNTSKIENAEIVGFYLQKIINNDIKSGSDYLKRKKDLLKLDGFSVNDEGVLEKFDSSYKDSNMIKGMKVGNSGFYAYSKLLTKNQINKLIQIVNEKIEQASGEIINGNFDINPKRIGNKLVGCEFCKYSDLCFKQERDIVNLEEYKNYSFLDDDIN